MKRKKISGQSLVETAILNILIISGILAILHSCRGLVESHIASFLDLVAGPVP